MTETPEQRSRIMRAVRSRDTGPELAVRHLLRDLGFRGYRKNRKEIPGKPDIAFIGQKKAIFVHGCFWHGHVCQHGANAPKSNQSYWLPKIARNKARDEVNSSKLASLGWSALTVWECELRRSDLAETLAAFMRTGSEVHAGKGTRVVEQKRQSEPQYMTPVSRHNNNSRSGLGADVADKH
jgi:DNA mismatch endonuclease, patch repair protein